eukprot:gene20662-biopygen11619
MHGAARVPGGVRVVNAAPRNTTQAQAPPPLPLPAAAAAAATAVAVKAARATRRGKTLHSASAAAWRDAATR